MDKRSKELATMVEAAGLEELRIYHASSRVHVLARAPNGAEQTFSVSTGKGDYRGDLNESARMKRFARANPAPAKTALGIALAEAKVVEPPRVRPRITIDLEPPPAAPQLSIEPATTMTAPSKTINKISQVQFFKLCTWLQAADVKEAHSYQWIADRASVAIGATVSPSTVREAYTATDLELPERLRAPAVEPHVYVARELAAFMRKLGENPSEELMAIAGKLERV